MVIDLIIIGGGAAGIFAAVCAKKQRPKARVVVLEKTGVLLAKVKVSGGGRCNVTHSCFDPAVLSAHYPRGSRELLGPFHRFQPKDTVEWFSSRGVSLKTEADGRIFPVTNSSETIISCLLSEAQKLGVEIKLRQNVLQVAKEGNHFVIEMQEGGRYACEKLILATGSSPIGHALAKSFGHSIQQPVPSLFTFNTPSSALKELSGISLESVEIKIQGAKFSQTGPLLLTHFGFSGPAALKLSAFAARHLYEKEYKVTLLINWLPAYTEQAIRPKLLEPKNPFRLPKNLWKHLAGGEKDLYALAHKLHADPYQVEGKTTHKEEFVTCGGVTLKEIDFKTMGSRVCSNLFFAGEILDIDGVTGGFNFQNAWTTGYIAGTFSI